MDRSHTTEAVTVANVSATVMEVIKTTKAPEQTALRMLSGGLYATLTAIGFCFHILFMIAVISLKKSKEPFYVLIQLVAFADFLVYMAQIVVVIPACFMRQSSFLGSIFLQKHI